ncbi:hypothetical protein LTR28_000184, partial [Elasticomyces elasticus]
MAGEPCVFIEPKLMFGRAFCPTGPPFGMFPLAPDAVMTTEGFLRCSVCDTPFAVFELLITGWPPALCADDGASDLTLFGETEFTFPYCAGAGAAAVADGAVVLDSADVCEAALVAP